LTEITSRSNEGVKRLSKLISDAKERRQRGVVVLETVKLVSDALVSGARISELWLTQKALASGAFNVSNLELNGIKVYLMADHVAEKLSSQSTPQGAVAVAEMPKNPDIESVASLERVLVLSGVQDPGNVGAALRSAAAFGYGAAVLDGRCADPYSPKALRASMGAAFRMKLVIGADAEDAIGKLRSRGFAAYAAALDERAVHAGETTYAEKIALVIGSEGQGLLQNVIDACSSTVIIPIQSGVESLNAASAAAVLMWIYRRQHG